MQATKKTFKGKFLLVALILVIAFLTLFILMPNFKAKIDTFLSNSSFANILNLKTIKYAEAVDCTTFNTTLNLHNDGGIGSGGEKSRSYDIYLSQDMLAAAKNGKISIKAEGQVYVKYLFGATMKGIIEILNSSGGVIANSGWFETAKNYSGTKYATGSVDVNASSIGSYFKVRIRVDSNTGSAERYIGYLRCSVNKSGSASNSCNITSGINTNTGEVSSTIGAVKATITSTAGVKRILVEKQEPGSSSWVGAGIDTTYNSESVSTSCDASTTKYLTLSGSYKYGTKLKIRYQNNFRDWSECSTIITFKPKFTVVSENTGVLPNTSFGINGTSTRTFSGWTYGSNDPTFYVETNLPADGYFLRGIVCPQIGINDPVNFKSGRKASISSNMRNNNLTYSNINVTITIKLESFSTKQKDTTIVYNGIPNGSSQDSHANNINEYVVSSTSLPTGFSLSSKKSSNLARYMTDIGPYGYITSVMCDGVEVGKKTVASTSTSERLTIERRDITSAFNFSYLDYITKTYNNSTGATLPTSGFSISSHANPDTGQANSNDGLVLSISSATFNDKNVGSDKEIIFKFKLSGLDSRANNYKAKLIFVQETRNGSYIPDTSTITNLYNDVEVTVTRKQGGSISHKILDENALSVTIAGKTYDKTNAATITGATISTTENDNLTVTWTGAGSAIFTNVNVGTQNVNVTGLKFSFNLPSVAANYKLQEKVLTTSAEFEKIVSVNITPASLTLVIANEPTDKIEKVYDGNIDIQQGLLKYEFGTAPIGTDANVISVRKNVFLAKYDNQNVGESKTVINIPTAGHRPKVISEALEVNDPGLSYLLGNYQIISAETQKEGIGKITRREITMSMSVPGEVAKIFDWNTNTKGVYTSKNATTTSDVNIVFSVNGLVAGDIVSPTDDVRNGAYFTDWKVGIQTIEANAAITSTNGVHNNYKLPENKKISCTARIEKKPLTHQTITIRYNGNFANNSTLAQTFIFNGKSHEPIVTIQDSQKNNENGGGTVELTKGTHFAVEYINNINVSSSTNGTAIVKVSARGAYYQTSTVGTEESIDVTFNIVKANVKLTSNPINIVYGTFLNNENLSGVVEHSTDASYTTEIEGTWYFVNSPNTFFNAGNHTPSVRYVLEEDSLSKFNQPADITVNINVSKRPINVVATGVSQNFGDRYINIAKSFRTSDPAGEDGYPNGIVKLGNMSFDPNITLKTTAKQLYDTDVPEENTFNTAIVGEYDVLLDAIGNTNYKLGTYTKAKYTVTKRAIKITPDTGNRIVNGETQNTSKKTYGEDDPVFFYKTELTNPDNNTYLLHVVIPGFPLEGYIDREKNVEDERESENVGSYYYTEGNITIPELNPNYEITFNRGARDFEITRRDIELTMKNVEQIYGDPAIGLSEVGVGYTITKGLMPNGKLPFDDTLVGSPLRVNLDYELTNNTDAGLYYIINRSDEEVCIRNGNNPNYNIIDDPYPFSRKAQYTITRRTITIIPKHNVIDGKQIYHIESKYGDKIPVISLNSNEEPFVFQNTLYPEKPALASWDTIVTRIKVKNATNQDDICINVGDREFDISDFKNNQTWNKNYIILLSGESETNSDPVYFRINKRPITISPSIVNIDYLSAPPAEETLTFAPVVVNAESYGLVLGDTLGQPKPEGQTQPIISISLAYERDDFGNIPTETGFYNIIATSSLEHSKYLITFDGNNKFVINKLEAHIQPITGQNIVYGNLVPTITYVAWTRSGAIIDSSLLSGSLEIEYTGTYATPGNYEIKQGTLVNDLDGTNPNEDYVIVFNSRYDNTISECVDINPVSFQVKKKPIEIIPDAGQYKYFDGKYSDDEPAYGYILSTTLVENDSIQGNLKRAEGNLVGLYSYLLGTIETVNGDSEVVQNYDFTIRADTNFQIKQRPIMITPDSNISSVYGAAQDTQITYTVQPRSPLEASDVGIIDSFPLSGNLQRNPGRNVALYAIQLGTISGAQYDIKLNPITVYYEITKRNLEITANATFAAFGEYEKAITYRFTGGAQPAYGETLNGALVRENLDIITVGQYDILQGTLTNDNNPNYNINFVSAKYTITKRKINIAPNTNQNKIYGQSDPTFTYSVNAEYAGNPLVVGHPLSGVLSREEGEDVGSYSILQGTLSNYIDGNDPNPNYQIYFEASVRFEIKKSPTVITVEGMTVIDDVTTKTLTYKGEEQFIKMTHTNTDTPGPNVGDWEYKGTHFEKGGYQNAGNYNLIIRTSSTKNFEEGVLMLVVVVEKARLDDIETNQIASESLTKIYGDFDPVFSITRTGLGFDGELTISFERENGEDFGSYDFLDSSILIDNPNYIISFAAGENVDAFSITKREKFIEPNKFTKIYGTEDTLIRQVITTTNPLFSDTVTLTYERDLDNKNVGIYDLISVSCNNANYIYSFSGNSNINKFEILRRNVYVSADDKESTYSESLKSLSYTVQGTTQNEGLFGTDTLIGDVACDTEENYAGSYVITIGTLTNENNPNYNIIFTNGTYVIKQIEVTITPNNIVLEYGDDPQDLTYEISPLDAVLSTDSLEGELYVADKENVGIYPIEQGTLNNEDGRNRNYKIIFITTSTYTINIRKLVVLPEEVHIVYGEEYTINYTIVEGSLINDDILLGKLGHSGGNSKNVGEYKVTIGTLNSANQNYNVTLANNNIGFSITKRPLTITARDVEQEYGANGKPLSYDITSGNLVYNDTLSGVLRRTNGYAVGVYTIYQGNLDNPNYDITFITADYKITKAKLTIKIHDISIERGEPIEIDQHGYTIISGRVVSNDNLNISLYKDPTGTAIGEYAIIGTYDNANYEITFIDGVFTIRKLNAVININSTHIVKKYDGKPISIAATSSSSQPIEVYIGDEKVENNFIEPGNYYLTLKSLGTDEYNAPAPLDITLTILKDTLTVENLGIDIVLQSEEGYDPDYIVELERNEKDEPIISSALTRSQKLIRSYKIVVVDSQSNEKITTGTSTLKIKVPEALSGNDTAKIIVFDDNTNNYSYKTAIIDNSGYITVDITNASSIAFVQESSSNILIYIIIGIVSLIIVVTVMIFALRKRR
ncbi:MAG TPA: hypothetical protein GX709_01430 [Clostridiales bacterium]|nr:hypothetical protein [Clostridiales bacterium]